MKIDDIAGKIFDGARAAGAEAEIYYEEYEDRPVEYEDNTLKYLATKIERGIGLRVILNGRLGFSSTSDFGKIDELLQNALESAKYGEKAAFTFPSKCDVADVKTFDDAVAACTTKELVDVGDELIQRLLARHPKIKCTADVDAETSEERIINTSGLDIGHRSTSFGADVAALEVKNDGLLWAGDGYDSAKLDKNVAALADKVATDLDWAKRDTTLKTGTYPAIFAPNTMIMLFTTICDGVNGKLVQKGSSPLSGKIGEQLFDERISIYDDPLLDYGPSSAPHDTEGIRSARTTLVERGVLKSFIYDLQTAGLMGKKPTGNGLRGYDTRPGPGHNNTMILPGDTPVSEMIKGMKRGLFVENVIGAGTCNTLAGDFSVNIGLGYLIENGEVRGRVKNCMIYGNVYELLKNGVASIGDKAEMKESISLPHFLFSGISVAGQ